MAIFQTELFRCNELSDDCRTACRLCSTDITSEAWWFRIFFYAMDFVLNPLKSFCGNWLEWMINFTCMHPNMHARMKGSILLSYCCEQLIIPQSGFIRKFPADTVEWAIILLDIKVFPHNELSSLFWWAIFCFINSSFVDSGKTYQRPGSTHVPGACWTNFINNVPFSRLFRYCQLRLRALLWKCCFNFLFIFSWHC